MKMKDGKKVGLFVDRWDYFGTEMPKFNLEGNTKIGTTIGCGLSLLLMVTIFSYGISRGYIFVMKLRPNISTYHLDHARGDDEIRDLAAANFKVAFSVERISNDGVFPIDDDPDYVEW